MPTIVLPRQPSSAERWAGAAVGVGQALGGLSELMFALEQRKQNEKRNEMIEAMGALELFGGDPSAAPVAVQQKLIDAFGIEGAMKDPVTGNYMFPRSAKMKLADKQLAFKDQAYAQALANPKDPEATRDVRIYEGLEN